MSGRWSMNRRSTPRGAWPRRRIELRKGSGNVQRRPERTPMPNWPDPDRPGFPLHSERNGYHAVRDADGVVGIMRWSASGNSGRWHMHGTAAWLAPETVWNWTYVSEIALPK